MVVARKLKPYFDAHQVIVLTDLPLEKSLDKIERSRRLAKLAIELNGYGIKYQARTVIKGRALADIFATCAHNPELRKDALVWQLLIDGSSRNIGAGAGAVLISPKGKTIEYALKFQFRATNNKVEYEAAIAGLQLCRALEAKDVRLRMDSQLVVNQILGE